MQAREVYWPGLPWPPHAIRWALRQVGLDDGAPAPASAEDAVVLIGQSSFDGLYEAATTTHRHLLGWSAAELRSVPWCEFVHPGDRDGLVEGLEIMLQVGRWDEVEVRFLNQGGTYRRLLWSFLVDHARELTYCVARDRGADAAGTGPVRVSSWRWDPHSDAMSWSGNLFEAPHAPQPGNHVPLRFRDFLSRVHEEDRWRLDGEMQADLHHRQPVSETVRVELPSGAQSVRFAGTMAADDRVGALATGIAQAPA